MYLPAEPDAPPELVKRAAAIVTAALREAGADETRAADNYFIQFIVRLWIERKITRGTFVAECRWLVEHEHPELRL